jgi:hypothetical protein
MIPAREPQKKLKAGLVAWQAAREILQLLARQVGMSKQVSGDGKS